MKIDEAIVNENKNFVFIEKTYRIAKIEMMEYLHNYHDTVDSVSFIPPFVIKLKNGDVFTYVSWSDYDRWCKGRTYYIGARKYHSGFEVIDRN